MTHTKNAQEGPRTRSRSLLTSPAQRHRKTHRNTPGKERLLSNSEGESGRAEDEDELDIIGQADESITSTSPKKIFSTPSHSKKRIRNLRSDSVTTSKKLRDDSPLCLSRKSPRVQVPELEGGRRSSRQQEKVIHSPDMPNPSSLTLKQKEIVVVVPPVKKQVPRQVPAPLKKTVTQATPLKPSSSYVDLPSLLPNKFLLSLREQKSAVLKALHKPSIAACSSSYLSIKNQLQDLANGSINRHEGNSCLILGPRGCGKSRLIDDFLSSIHSAPGNFPVIIRLSAYFQTNDRLAMGEIVRQVQQQVGISFFSSESVTFTEDNDDDNDASVLAPAHLSSIISALRCLGRPVIVVLDAFDGFANHSRQALLYCLLDTVQSCRGGTGLTRTEDQLLHPLDNGEDFTMETGQGSNNTSSHNDLKSEHGVLVIGVTSRVDCLTILEKRVKSRFSHRVMRLGLSGDLDDIRSVLDAALKVRPAAQCTEEWSILWEHSVDAFLSDQRVVDILQEALAFAKDVRSFLKLMISPVLKLSATTPWLNGSLLMTSISTQRSSVQFPFLSALPYPHMSLLISATHCVIAGQDFFNFEMLYDRFANQVRKLSSAPMQTERLGLRMLNASRTTMFGAFEDLVLYRVFTPVAPFTAHVTKEFARYRCVAERDDIKSAVEQRGQTNLMKWFARNE